MTYQGLFDRYQPLEGRDWIRNVEPEDRKVFSSLGFAASDYGRTGGRVRAKTARRDENGKFLSNKKGDK